MLAGAILGFRKGSLAVLLFLVLVAAGLPLLAGGRGGIAYLTTAPSAGYPWGFLLGAAFIGYFTERMLPNYVFWKGLLITAVGGIVLIYAVGIPVTALNTDLSLWVAASRVGRLPARRPDQGAGHRRRRAAGPPRLSRFDRRTAPDEG